MNLIKKLRYKFVITSMCMLLSAFSIFFFVNHLYVKYWDEQEALEILEWYSTSDSFFNALTAPGEDITITINPIYSITLSKDLQILDILSSAKINTNTISHDIIISIFDKPLDNHKTGSYIYIVEETDDCYHLTITDMATPRAGITQILGAILLTLTAIILLLVISFWLSGFVADPARKALEREKRFISDASHELKTPLAAISVNAEALKSQEGENKYLSYIISETKRMDVLIKNLLKLSYLDEAETSIVKEEFSLSCCVEEIILALESTIYESNIHFSYDILPNLIYLGNEAQLKQLVAILMDNAIKNTPSSGVITFSLTQKYHHPVITVENTGDGINAEVLPHIFERFYKPDSSRNSNSYGLGLSIAKAIVESHGGAISVESTPGKSTCFTVRL